MVENKKRLVPFSLEKKSISSKLYLFYFSHCIDIFVLMCRTYKSCTNIFKCLSPSENKARMQVLLFTEAVAVVLTFANISALEAKRRPIGRIDWSSRKTWGLLIEALGK